MGFRFQVWMFSLMGVLSACNKMSISSGEKVPDSEAKKQSDKADSDSNPPTAITGTNLVDLKNGSLGLEVEFKASLEAKVTVKWFVKKDSEKPNAPADYLEANGFAEHVGLDGNYKIIVNGEDISSRCALAASTYEAVCEHLKVSSPVISASVTAGLIHLKSKSVGNFEAHTPYISKVSPGSLLASGGTLQIEGGGFSAPGLEVSLQQGQESKISCLVPKIDSDGMLSCDQPEVTAFSGSVDIKVMTEGQSFIYRAAYRINGQDLFQNTNCEQAIAAIGAPGITNAWSAPAFDLADQSSGTFIGSGPTKAVVVNGLSTYALNHVDQGVIRGAETVAQWCVSNSAGGKNSGVMTINPDGSYNQTIPLFCGKQLVYLMPKSGIKTAIGVYEVTRANCTTNELMVTLSWGATGSDLELHLIRAGGVLNNLDAKTNDCMWSSCISGSPDWGVIGDVSDNPKKDIDWIGTNGTENISLPKPEKTSYDMYVEYWGTGSPSDARVTVNALGTADTIALSDVAFDKNGVPTKGSFISYRWVWWVGRVNFINGAPSIQFNKKVSTQQASSVLFDCNSNWSGGCRTNVTPSTLPAPL